MTALLIAPIVLSSLVLAAHFLRSGNFLGTAAALALVALVFVRRPWAAQVVQAALWAGTIEWIRALVSFTSSRMRAGEPWGRLVVILGAVASFTLLSSLLFFTPGLRANYRGAGRGAAS